MTPEGSLPLTLSSANWLKNVSLVTRKGFAPSAALQRLACVKSIHNNTVGLEGGTSEGQLRSIEGG
jgi:hypothetical protein